MDVVIKELPALRVAAVMHKGTFHRISEAFQRLHGIVGDTPDLTRDATLLAIYESDPETTPEPDLVSWAGITVPADTALPAELTERTVSAGRYGATTHIGPYETLGGVWQKLKHEWLPGSGQTPRAAGSLEMYRNTPAQVPKEKLETELFIPIR